MAQKWTKSGQKSDHFIIKFSLQLELVFYLDDKGRAIAKNPERPEDWEFILNSLSSFESPEASLSLSPEECAGKLNRYLHRKHIHEEVFRRYHVSLYQGNISSKAKQVISDIWNQFPFSRTSERIYISPFRRAALLKHGLTHKGNIASLFYDAIKKTSEVDSTLEAFIGSDQEVILVKITRRRMLSLRNLAAERISLLLNNKNDLQNLVNHTQLPAPCIEDIERGL